MGANDSSSGLGLDAGGTQTRWAVADAGGRITAEGSLAGLSALELTGAEGRQRIQALLQDLAQACGPVGRVVAGVTALDSAQTRLLCHLLGGALGLTAHQVQAMSDIELACRASFQPGQGIVLYAGTGSIAAHLDARGELHRAGGRGALIDDAGGGHWIARQALCRVWRIDDESPDQGAATPLGQALARHIGGADWAATRQWVYGATRGELGRLALAVAQAAIEGDAAAVATLESAGAELARLARALIGRVGPQPLLLAGRAFDLHPAIEARLRAELRPVWPATRPIERNRVAAEHAAARLAQQGLVAIERGHRP